ncbi:MAG: DUF6544 family protein, partial [Acidimicrobiales bacterium]
RCEAWQYNTAPEIGRVFHMRIDIARVIPMVGRDTYVHGHGLMNGKLLGLVTVAHGEGAEFDIGELTTYLNDAVLLAPSMLLTPAVTWAAVDDGSFLVSLTDAGRAVRGRVFIDGRGAPCNFSSTDRYAALPGGPVRARWSTPMDDFTVVGGRPTGLRGSAVWHLPAGPFEYGRLVLAHRGVQFNVWPGDARPARMRASEVAG